MERPHSTPHWVLIQNGRHFIKKPSHLLQERKKRPVVVHTSSQHWETHRVYLLYRNHRAAERISEGGGPQMCNLWWLFSLFLKSVNILWRLLLREHMRRPHVTFYQMRAEELLKHKAAVAGEGSGAEHGVKTGVISHMNACRHAPSLIWSRFGTCTFCMVCGNRLLIVFKSLKALKHLINLRFCLKIFRGAFCALTEGKAEELDRKWETERETMTCKGPHGGIKPVAASARTQPLYMGRPLYQRIPEDPVTRFVYVA